MDRDAYMHSLDKDVTDLVWTKGKEVWEVSLRKQGLCWVLNMVRTQDAWLSQRLSATTQRKTIQNTETKTSKLHNSQRRHSVNVIWNQVWTKKEFEEEETIRLSQFHMNSIQFHMNSIQFHIRLSLFFPWISEFTVAHSRSHTSIMCQ